MKTIVFAFLLSTIFWGCDKELDVDTTPPEPPQGIRTISLDNAVELQWFPSQAEDVKGYNVWVSDQYDGSYSLISSVASTDFVDYGAVNGVTYYYAVSAYDFDENESDLSKDVIYDTPRPEGYNVDLSDRFNAPNIAGYDFSQYKILRYDDINTDFFFENSNALYYIVVWNDSEIQDMGYTKSLDEISSSPIQGWNPSKIAEAVIGHTYIVKTWNEHYAKVRVKDVGANRLLFDWAYQTAQGNPELKITKSHPLERKPLQRVLFPE